MFEVRVLGATKPFIAQNTAELCNHLRENHKGHHVSVRYKHPTGIKRLAFVSVTDRGLIRESYGEQRPINFEALIPK
jgi:hypothetical protein